MLLSIQYQMFLAQIFSLACIVLGIYISIDFFNDQDISKLAPAKTQYHLGCFLADHNLTHSHDLAEKVQELQGKTSTDSLVSQRFGFDELFNKQGIQVASKFEDFIDQCLTYKEKMRSHVELAKATNKAYQEYLHCAQALSQLSSFSKTECTANWKDYQKCTIELEQLKKGFSAKLQEKDHLRGRMGDLFVQKQGGKEKTSGKASQLEKNFRIKDKELQEIERQMETKVKLVMQRVTNFHYNFAVLQNNTLHAKMLYDECHDHIKEYRSCEELSDEIRSLGHGSMESLELKVSKKRLALSKIQQMLSENQGDQTSRELEIHYHRGLLQYKKLHKLFAEMKARMEKHCGCSEADERRLKLALDAAQDKQQQAKREEESINATFTDAYNKLAQIRGKREKLMADFTDAYEKISTQKDTTINIIEIISQLEEEDKVLEIELLTFRKDFNSLEFKCNQIKDQLSLKLPAIDSFTSCNNKKLYFERLKQKLDSSARREQSMDEKTKQSLRESLKAFKI